MKKIFVELIDRLKNERKSATRIANNKIPWRHGRPQDTTKTQNLDHLSPPPSMTAAVSTVFCELGAQRSAVPVPRQRTAVPSPDGGKILLQPRICTLRSYGSDERGAVMRMRKTRDDVERTNFFASLVEYVESSRKSHDLEIVFGRLAMVVFACAVSMEMVTGNSLFQKLDLQQLAGGGGGICLAVITFAATFARLSSARTKIGQIFTQQCNSFVDSLINDIINGLFCEIGQNDWSDEV